ncbi:hypothetical protein EMCRGX_G021949 [Ephydatia muelleri]
MSENFRSSYYGTLGVSSVAVVKPPSSLDVLIKAEVLDVEKLKSICLQHTLTTFHRPLVWKTILGVSPTANNEATRLYVKEQRKQQLEDLKRCLKVVSKEPGTTPSPEEFSLLYLIEKNRLLVSKREEHTDLCAIAKPFIKLFPDYEDAYWLFSSFAAMWEAEIESTDLKTKFIYCLKNADRELHDHLLCTNTLNNLPFIQWFNQCFSDLLPELHLESVWDKVIAGSSTVLVYVAVALILDRKQYLMAVKSKDGMYEIFQDIPMGAFMDIVTRGIRDWSVSGSIVDRHK